MKFLCREEKRRRACAKAGASGFQGCLYEFDISFAINFAEHKIRIRE